MDTLNSISSSIRSTLQAMANSEDYCDKETITQFLILIAECKDNSKELITLTNEELKGLSNCMTAVLASNFISIYPSYSNQSTGEIACAVGFYAFMKLIEKRIMPSYFLFVVLLHNGRRYIKEILKNILLNADMSPYNPFDLQDYAFSSNKADAIVKGFELSLLIIIDNMGFKDQDLLRWKYELVAENETIKQQIGTDYIKYPRQLFNKLEKNFTSLDTFNFLSEI